MPRRDVFNGNTVKVLKTCSVAVVGAARPISDWARGAWSGGSAVEVSAFASVVNSICRGRLLSHTPIVMNNQRSKTCRLSTVDCLLFQCGLLDFNLKRRGG